MQTHDLVRKGQLLLGLVLHALGAVAAELLVNVRRVHHGDDGVQIAHALQVLVHKKGLRHGSGVREARGLDDDGVQLALLRDAAKGDFV